MDMAYRIKTPKKKIPALSREQWIEQSKLNEELFAGPDSATPKYASEIQIEMTRLAAGVACTAKIVAGLHDRLADVLAPEKDAVKGSDDDGEPSTSLGCRIREIHATINSINFRLVDIQDRLRL